MMNKGQLANAASHLLEAFGWSATPFPDLSDLEGQGYKWWVLCDFLKSQTENEHSLKAAACLKGAYVRGDMPFPSLQGLSTDCEKWWVVYAQLVSLSKEK